MRALSHRRGVTLIMVTGILAVLAAIAAGYYVNVLSTQIDASRMNDTAHADLMAGAGVYDAISRLREQCLHSTEGPNDSWFTSDYLHGARKRPSLAALANPPIIEGETKMSFTRSLSNSVGRDSDRYSLTVTDAASKINVNAGDNLGVILDNLCRLIGPPLVAADLDAIQPRRWATEGAPKGEYDTETNSDDTPQQLDLYYRPDSAAENSARPLAGSDGNALYGDGYAIARYRSQHGKFAVLESVKYALTCQPNPEHPELETLERETKFNALRDYLTIASWVDTNTVCVGKFEWANGFGEQRPFRDPNAASVRGARLTSGYLQILIDRDKSWIADDPVNDPLNRRGSLRGSYVSIVNGHGSGQLRRIATNGIDWIGIEPDHKMVVEPGPISSYIISAREDAYLDSDGEPMTDSNGRLIDDPDIDYKQWPLCIHRAPVNVNTASEKVLAALFMGINVQHGTPLALGTDEDIDRTRNAWMMEDKLKLFGRIPTVAGSRRVPASSGKPILNRPEPWDDKANFGYINNYGSLGEPAFKHGGRTCNEAHELAYRIICARQRSIDPATGKPTTHPDPDPLTADPEGERGDPNSRGFERGLFTSWDDFYFRVIRPWDDIRSYGALPDPNLPGRVTIPHSNGLTHGQGKESLAHMLMAHFNPNTDILKFNPNIEWIDRWGRNFTSMEPVLVYDRMGQPMMATGIDCGPVPPGAPGREFYYIRSMRYRFDEMIDKTDLNRSTTEFALDSGGIFEIQSVGQVVKDNVVIAERKHDAVVQVYDVWRESTQRQFVNGIISLAANQASSFVSDADRSGSVARDAANVNHRLALNTLPEPLVPLRYNLHNNFGGRLEECVDNQPRNARGRPKNMYMPDIVANNVLPAIYDGQIVLATNTASFDPFNGDTFLASFNGDLDTDTCVGNGREQAKTPENAHIRVCDTISLLGLLNDTEIDLDPNSYPVFGINVSKYEGGMGSPLGPLSTLNYGNNVSCRMGDLRSDGVYCGILGTSCKDATLKYPIGDGPASDEKFGYGPKPKLIYQNYNPTQKSTVGMWFKPLWHQNDHLEHEFFSGTSNGHIWMARGNKLCKNGYVQGGARNTGWPVPDGSLWALTEAFNDDDITVALHSGTDRVNGLVPPNPHAETPCFHTQPFRWSYVGAVYQYNSKADVKKPKYDTGFWHRPTLADEIDACAKHIIRPYISTYRYPEGKKFSTQDMWGYIQVTYLDGCDLDGQPAAYPWEQSRNEKHKEGCFTLNNVNEGWHNGRFLHIYRQQPTDTTYSVIDELKIQKRALSSEEIGRVMSTSRYYLPVNTSDGAQLPTFTSQTLLQSVLGMEATGHQDIRLVRLTWTVFTPRFMHEYKEIGRYERYEIENGSGHMVKFHGPFDYAQYNADIDYDHDVGWKAPQKNHRNEYLSVNRPPPLATEQSPYTRGVSIQIFNGNQVMHGFTVDHDMKVPTSVFRNPDNFNGFLDLDHPDYVAVAQAEKLRYRVTFHYPVNPRVDPKATSVTVDPKLQFLLDTPVFDDISLTYMTAPRFISYRQVTE